MMKMKNNKGFSLVEIIVAIALMAIVVTPIMNSFISAARINRDARKIMSASDCAHAIMEAFSDGVDFGDVWAIAEGSKRFNLSLCAGSGLNGSNSVELGCPVSGVDQTYGATKIYDDDGNYALAKQFGQAMVASIGASEEKTLFRARSQCTNTSTVLGSGDRTLKDNQMGGVMFFGFANIDMGHKITDPSGGSSYVVNSNYKFDAVVMVFPASSDTSTGVPGTDRKNYPYFVKLYLFDHNDFAGIMTGTSTASPLIVLDGGFMSGIE